MKELLRHKNMRHEDRSSDHENGKCEACHDVGGFCHVCGTGDVNDD